MNDASTDPSPAKRVLIVEDEGLVAEVAALTLEDAGYVVLDICADARTAVGQVGRLAPDVTLIDINLGAGGSGLDVARFIVSRHGSPFIFVTGQSDAATRAQAMELRPADYLVKPYRPDELVAAVAGLPGRSTEEDAEPPR